jgi:diadenosine tetraphosphate (Ap4A) HIT family hydrolase
MAAMVRPGLPLLLGVLAAQLLDAQGVQCACDAKNPESMKARQCSLCNEAEKQPADVEFFTLKDINPRKPGRWLALPREHDEGQHHMHNLPKEKRVRLWRYAVRLAEEKFPGQWGLAYNGSSVRTQCHLHIHVGRFIRAAENSKYKLVRRIEDFPAPDDSGILIHPVEGGYHVHLGEQIMETALVR